DSLPAPADTAPPVVVTQEQVPQPGEHSAPSPLLEAAVERRAGAELAGRVLALAARAQHIEDAVEDRAEGDGGSAGRARPLLPTQEWLELLPQAVGDVPYCRQGGFVGSHCSVR